MTQPTLQQELAARAEAERQQAERDRLEREAAEREREAELRYRYSQGEETPAMARLTARLQWLHDLGTGGYRTPGDRIVPAHDRGEHAACVRASKEAVTAVLTPLIEQAEREYAEAEAERERIVRGR